MTLQKVKDNPLCEGCPMRDLLPDNVFVAPTMGTGLRLAIAESPGEDETFTGQPLTGGAGRWFNGILSKAGINRSELTIANTIQCRPPDNIYPTDPEARTYISKEQGEKVVDHCYRAHLLPLLKGRSWKRIDLLGDKALRRVAKLEGILKWRGSPVTVPDLAAPKLNDTSISNDAPAVAGTGPRIAIPTIHPAAIARSQELLPVVINDLGKSLVLPLERYDPFPMVERVREFRHTRFTYDIECDRWTQQISMVGLCAEPYTVLVVPFKGPYIGELKRIFADATEIIGHNSIQFDLPILRKQGISTNRDQLIEWDTMLLQHLRFPDLPHDLEFLGSQFSNKPAWKHDKESLEVYCARDVDITDQCFRQLRTLIKTEGLERLYHLVQVPLAKICHSMQQGGIKVDGSRLSVVRGKLLEEMSSLEDKIPSGIRSTPITVRKRSLAPAGTKSPKTGKPLRYLMEEVQELSKPWRSDAQLKEFLYETLGLPPQIHPKSERVTVDKKALERLSRRLISGKDSAYRIKGYSPEQNTEVGYQLKSLMRLNKLDTLTTSFLKEKTGHAGIQHPHFNVHGTASGRLSSSDPNLQNIPESARYIYVPSHPDWCWVEADFSSIENRLTAWFARDAGLLEKLSDPEFSEHKWVASLLFGIPYAEVEKDNDKDAPYGVAKRVNHGFNYMMGARRIAKENDMEEKVVKELVARLRKAKGKIVDWQSMVADEARTKGVLTTPFGRKRWFYTSSYATEACSFLPQSTAADIIFRSMIALYYERVGWPLEKAMQVVEKILPLPEPAKLRLQVHDSLLVECPRNMRDDVQHTMTSVMTQPWRELGGFSIPVAFKLGECGQSWGELS